MVGRLSRLLVGALLILPLAVLSPPAAHAAEAEELSFACATKGGALRYAATPACGKKETLVTFSVADPTVICVMADGTVRKVARASDCSKKPKGTPLTVPSNSVAYFCVNLEGNRLLLYVTDPAQCKPGETVLVVGNHAPTDIALSPDSVTENVPTGTVVGTLSATDQDAGDAHTFSLASGSGDTDNGEFAVVGNELQTAAAVDFEGQSSYSVRIATTDLLGLAFEEVLTITVVDVVENNAPTDISLSNDTVAENQPAGTLVGTLATTDPDAADTHTYTLVSGSGSGDNGVFAIDGDRLETDESLDFEGGPLSVRIQTDDGNGGTFSKQFAITVTDESDVPIATDDTKTVGEDSTGATIDVLANDTDQDNDPLTVTAVDMTGTTGTVTNNGTDVTYDPNGQFGNLGAGQTATDTFTYTVSDGNGGTDTATVTITITGANDAPDAADDAKTVARNDPQTTVDVLANDNDADASDTLTVTAVDTTGTQGTVTITNAGADVGYDPNGQFAGLGAGQTATDTFTYTVADGNGGTDTATVTITVTGVNTDPVASDDVATVGEDSSGTSVNVLANDTDANGDGLTVGAVDVTGTTGSVTNNGTDVTYDPNGQFDNLNAGQTATDTFTYTASDGNGGTDTATVTITITGANDAPTADDDAETVGEDSSATTVAVLANDTDADNGTTLSVFGIDTTGTSGVVTVINAGGAVSYDPNGQFDSLSAGETATDTFTYTASDGNGGTDTATVTITITGANDAPTAADDAKTVAKSDPATTVDVLANDTDPDTSDTLAISAVDTTGTSGTVTNNGTDVTYDPNGQFDNLAPGQTATDTFTYTVSDGNGTDTATVTITVNGTNAPPVATDDADTVGEDSSGAVIGVLANDTDVNGDTLTVSAVETTGTSGTVTNNGTNVTYDPNGQFEALAVGETATDSFTYTVSDGNGGTDTATVTITITGTNDAPTANDDTGTVGEDSTGATITVLGNDTDPDTSDTLTVSAVDTTGTSGTVTNNGTDVTYDPNGQFDNLAPGQTAIDTFTYTASDGNGGTDTATVTITVTGANDAPTDISLSNSSIDENLPAATTVGTLSATDPDNLTHAFSLVAGSGSDDNASFQVVGDQLKSNVSFNFEVKNSYSIRIRATDASGGILEEALAITINDVNDAPTASNDTYSGAIGNTLAVLGTTGTGPHVVLTGSLALANDSDEDGDTLSAVAETVASTGGGTATISADGSFTFLPGVGDKNQNDTFTYRVTDGTATANGTVTVGIINEMVWYVDDSAVAGDGRSTAPLSNLTPLNGAGGAGDADGSGDWIFLYSGTYGGGIRLETNQKLYGQLAGLTVATHSLVTAGGTIVQVGNAGGAGIELANGVAIRAVNVSATSGAGITGSNITTATVGGSPGGQTVVSSASGTAVNLSGAASGDITFTTQVVHTGGSPAVSVSGRSGGTVTFAGAISSTDQGITLSNNTGAHVNFTGNLTLDTGTDPAFSATGGGTVSAGAAANTLTTTTGTALRVQNTTIGADGLDFRSISSNGAVNGIVLQNTGTTAGLTVTGNSAGTCGGSVTGAGNFISGPDLNDCTGGKILNSTGTGILLSQTRSVSLSRMQVTGSGGDGIGGTSLTTGFLLSASTVTNNGNAAEENGIDLGDSAALTPQGATGNVSILNSTVTGSADSNVIIQNSTGSAFVQVDHSRIANADSAVGATQDNVQVEASGTATIGLIVNSNSMAAAKGDHIQVNAANGTGGGGTFSSAWIANNRMVGGASGSLGQGILVSAAGQSPLWSGSVKYDVNFNFINGAVSHAVTVSMGASGAGGSFNGFVRNNQIGTTGQALSCSTQGNGIFHKAEGSGTSTIQIDNNQIRRCFDRGIDIAARDGNGALNATVTSNIVIELSDTNNTTFTPREAFQLVAGSTSTNILGGIDSHTVCLGLTGNSFTGGVHKISDIRIRQRFRTRVNLPGYPGTAFDTTAVQSFVAGNNAGAATTATTNDDAGVTTDGYFNSASGAPCTLPTS